MTKNRIKLLIIFALIILVVLFVTAIVQSFVLQNLEAENKQLQKQYETAKSQQDFLDELK